MKNLKLSLELSWEVVLQSEGETLLLSAFDVEQNRVFFASSANNIYTVHLPSSSQERALIGKSVLSSQGEPVALENGDSITALDYQMEKEALIIGTSNGYMVLYIVDCNATEVVVKVEGGVKCIASSPDGALLTVATGLGQLLVMTHDWEILYETELDPQLVDEIHCHSLVDKIDGSYSSEAQCCISWRGDGKYFATLSGFQNSSSLRKIRIWERDSGTLHAATDSKVFMGSSCDWMPSGAKVACAYDRKAENKCPSIVFFEKNGLERSSFSINECLETQVKALKWNCSSDLLAASIICQEYDAIKIWSFSNNHWYLKQEMRYLKKDDIKFAWNPTKPLQLICWTRGGKVTTYSFVWMAAVTETSVALVVDNSSILASPLALSLMPPPMSLFKLRFSSAIRDISFHANNSENHLAVLLSDGDLCVVELPSTDTWEQLEDKTFTIQTCLSDLPLSPFWQLTWLDSHILLGVSHSKYSDYNNQSTVFLGENGFSNKDYMISSHDYYLQEIELVCSSNCEEFVTSSGWHVKNSRKLRIEGPIISIVQNPAKSCSAFVQLDGGTIFEYASTLNTKDSSREQHLHKLDSDNVFPSSCPWMKAVLVSDNGILKPLIFGLDDSGRLHVGRRILCNSCSSFSFYSDSGGLLQQVTTHLILTTKQDMLFIFNMDEILHGNPEIQIESCSRGSIQPRKDESKDFIPIWERGAKLVGVIHGDEAAVILQANRGNLECIYPRKLVLVAIVNALVQKRFRDAMLLVRRHRLDFNVIVDYCGWQTFVKSSGEFVSQVSNLGYITDFVCAIKNENVMETLYKTVGSLPCTKSTLRLGSLDPEDFHLKNKVSNVLRAIRKALEELIVVSPERELCILTTLARSEPPALEEALGRVKVIREMELLGVNDSRRKTCPSAEEAVKHLLWLSDPEAVYEAALGLYDLNLSAIVALNSQKDPKEFLPFLQALEQLPPVIMRYKIDLKLHRYESALQHIASAGENYYEDSMRLLQSNPELFPLGLKLFADAPKRKQVLEAWGDHLHREKCYENAATAYISCSSFQKALKAYRACGDWKGVLTVAGLLKLGKEAVLQLANELCEELQALGKPAEAAKIALEYCGDVASCVGYFVMAREWEEALRIAYLLERDDLISEVTVAATDCANTLVSEYNEGSEKVGKYVARYMAVRQRRLLLAAKLQMEDRPVHDLEDDNVSEASSTFSGMSAYTTSSTLKGSGASVSPSSASKGREMRRQRNRGKIRAGSPGEENALREHLKGMLLTSTAQCELKSLVLALAMLGKIEMARQLQRVADNFHWSQQAAVKLCEDTSSTEIIDENAHTLENYVNKIKGAPSFLGCVMVV